MTRNFADEGKYISVEGIENALEVARVLLKNNYEVFMELDDCNIYCVHYSITKNKYYGNAAFCRITEEDAELLEQKHSEASNQED